MGAFGHYINNMKNFKYIIAPLLLLPLYAIADDCENNAVYKSNPSTVSRDKTVLICNDEYTVMYSPKNKTPIWVANHLTSYSVTAAKAIKRSGSFRTDTRVNTFSQALNKDYLNSGYDKGHLFPRADATNDKSEYQSFLYTNAAPQDQKLNSGIWSKLEKRTRNIALTKNDVYVVTGVLFNNHPSTIGDGVYVPSLFWKAIYVPSINKTGVAIADNVSNSKIKYISLSEFKSMSNIDVFPSVSSDRKSTVYKW